MHSLSLFSHWLSFGPWASKRKCMAFPCEKYMLNVLRLKRALVPWNVIDWCMIVCSILSDHTKLYRHIKVFAYIFSDPPILHRLTAGMFTLIYFILVSNMGALCLKFLCFSTAVMENFCRAEVGSCEPTLSCGNILYIIKFVFF